MRMKIAVLLAGALVVAGLLAAGEDAKPSGADRKRPEDEIKSLIGQLADQRFKVREAATRRLMERDDALPALREALRSPDADVRGRAKMAINAILKRRAIAAVKRGQTDRFIDLVAQLGEGADKECWRAVIQHAQDIVAAAGKLGGKEPPLLWGPLQEHPVTIATERKTDDRIADERVIAERGIAGLQIHRCVLICGESVETKAGLGFSVVCANGNLKMGDRDNLGQIYGCVVVCDGDVMVSAMVEDSIILARGDVRVKHHVKGSVILSGGDVKVGSFVNQSVIKKNERDFLNAVSFFNLWGAGIKIEPSRDTARVEKVDGEKPFAQAGVRKGDRIIAMDGVEVASSEAFRRWLRRRIQFPGKTTLELRREGDNRRVDIYFSELHR